MAGVRIIAAGTRNIAFPWLFHYVSECNVTKNTTPLNFWFAFSQRLESLKPATATEKKRIAMTPRMEKQSKCHMRAAMPRLEPQAHNRMTILPQALRFKKLVETHHRLKA